MSKITDTEGNNEPHRQPPSPAAGLLFMVGGLCVFQTLLAWVDPLL